MKIDIDQLNHHPRRHPMTDAETLKPCPFCGGNAGIARDPCPDGGGFFAFIRCYRCSARGRETYYSRGNDCPQTYANLRNAWNTRAALPALEVTVAEAAEVVVRYLESEYRTISYEESTHLSAQKHKEFTAYLYAVSHLRALTGDTP